jgi:hypothetical protein
MTLSTRQALLQALLELGSLHPGMRFGQLVEFASLLATDQDGPELLPRAADAAILEACREHLRQRAGQFAELQNGDRPGLAPPRADLVTALEELGHRYPSWEFGQLVTRLVGAARANTYDVEDEQLLEVARDYLSGQAHAAHAERTRIPWRLREGQGQTTENIYEDAVNLIVNGFCKEVFRELPMEFAVEAQTLLGVSLEGSVG